MRILSWAEFLAAGTFGKPLAATVGVFDGLHAGHRKLISTVTSKAPAMLPTVVTFADNPKRLLHPKTFHGDLYSLEEKLGLIEATGIELCILIDFSAEFGKLSGRGFLSSLHHPAGLGFIAMGTDFRCGYRLDTDAEGIAAMCKEEDIGVEILGPVLWNGKPISSSRIRRALLDGRVADAAHMLGRAYDVAPGTEALERISDTQIAFRAPDLPILPPDGVYVVDADMPSGSLRTTVRIASGLWKLHAPGMPAAIHFIDSESHEHKEIEQSCP